MRLATIQVMITKLTTQNKQKCINNEYTATNNNSNKLAVVTYLQAT